MIFQYSKYLDKKNRLFLVIAASQKNVMLLDVQKEKPNMVSNAQMDVWIENGNLRKVFDIEIK